MSLSRVLIAMGFGLMASVAIAEVPAVDPPYKVVKTAKVGGSGGYDYVYADTDSRKLFVPRSDGANSRVDVYDLESLKPVGTIAKTAGVHGVAVDAKSKHGFSSSKPVVMFDTNTLATIKTIDVEGNPDGIYCDDATQRIFVLSHKAPNVTVIDAKEGAIVGTIDVGGAVEQAAGDGSGHLYIDVEDKDNVAAIDLKTLKVTAHYDLGGKGGTPAGLAMDVKNRLLFVACRKPATMVVMNADDGKIITTLPIGAGVDAAEFNPATMEAFSSQRDGTLSVIKEKSPTEFVVAQTVTTKPGAKTSTLDAKTGQIYLIAAEQGPAPAGGRGRGSMVPDSFTIIVVGK